MNWPVPPASSNRMMVRTWSGARWAQSHAGRRYPFHYGMGLGRGAVIEAEGGPPRIESSVSEVGQLWLYRSWAHWMAAESWDDLKANHPTLEEGYV